MIELVFVCDPDENGCGKEYDKEWLLTLPKSEEGKFQCPCAFDEKGEEIFTHSVFTIEVVEV